MKITQSKLLNRFKNLTYTFTTKEDKNLAFHVGDNYNDVLNNHKALALKLNYEQKKLIHMKQIHSNIVHIVSDKDNFENPPTCDALITNRVATPLMVMVADCTPILFYDDKQKVIAVAHAGRQGAFKNILKSVIDAFKAEYNSKVEDIFVSIGANIGSCCYEVGSEIYEEAKLLNLEYALETRDNSLYLDISKIVKTQLLMLGIKEEHLEISDECSCCQKDKYFSYRAKRITGRFGGIIFLK